MDSNYFNSILRRHEELSKLDDNLVEFMKRSGYECESAIDDSTDFDFQPELKPPTKIKRNKAKTNMQRKSRKKNRKGDI